MPALCRWQAQNGTARGAHPVMVMVFGSDVAWHEGRTVPAVGNIKFTNVTVVDSGRATDKDRRSFLSLLTPAQPLRTGGHSTPNGSLVYNVTGNVDVAEEGPCPDPSTPDGCPPKIGCMPELGPRPDERGVSLSVRCETRS